MNTIFPTDKILLRADKEKMLKQHGIAIWMTGLSGSGKTTIAIALEQELHKKGLLTQVLDGDNIRSGINNNLGFSDADRTENNSLLAFYARMWFAPAFAVTGGILLSFLQPSTLPYSLPVLLVWLAAPYFVWWISLPIESEAPEFTNEQTLLLHRIARKTWNFFETFVNAGENWLPPDNFQEIPEPIIASRTSPTNIGLS